MEQKYSITWYLDVYKSKQFMIGVVTGNLFHRAAPKILCKITKKIIRKYRYMFSLHTSIYSRQKKNYRKRFLYNNNKLNRREENTTITKC